MDSTIHIDYNSPTQGNPYLPLWEYTPDVEPYVFEDPDNSGKLRLYVYGSHDMYKNAYCGDDLNDLAAMALCGFVACPADAAPEVKSRADYQCPQRGGEGAVRGAVEHILRTDGRWHDAVKAAFHVDV